jgi:hypothetical protein
LRKSAFSVELNLTFSVTVARLPRSKKSKFQIACGSFPCQTMSEKSNSRLNPKLTKRALASSLPLGDASLETGSQASETTITSRSSATSSSSGSTHSGISGSSGSSSSSSSADLVIPYTNPRIHLLHNGKWIPKRVSWIFYLISGIVTNVATHVFFFFLLHLSRYTV